MGFNCLAVDLRWGKKDFWNKIPNETARRNGTYEVVDNYERTDEYQLTKVWPIIWKAYEDMKAAMEYLKAEGYDQKTVVVGSSFSAMLVFKLAFDGLPVDGIIAFSPGEYHPKEDGLLALWAREVKVPVYLSGGKEEEKVIEEVAGFFPVGIPVSMHHSEGRHGASVLITEEEDWSPLGQFLEEFLVSQKRIGFRVFNSYRLSRQWEDGKKPIRAWYWYPLSDADENEPMARVEYIIQMNPDKTKEENLVTFHRIISSLTDNPPAIESVQSYLDLKSQVILNAKPTASDQPLVVLSGAHPIYFTALAEQFAMSGYRVVSVPRAGMKKGERLPFSKEGVEEYRKDLNTILDHVEHEGLVDMDHISFVSWSFEGLPTLQVALERNATGFVSLDSSLGYEYGIGLISNKTLRKLPFKLIHYTGKATDHGKDLHFLEDDPDIQIISEFDLEHGDFTSLSAVTIPEMIGTSTSFYEELIAALINHLNSNK